MTSSGRVSRRALSLRDAGFAPVHGPLARRRTAGAAAGILARQLASASRLTVAGQHRNQTGLPPLVAYAVRVAVYPPPPAASPDPSAPALLSPTLNHARESAALDRAGGRHVLRRRRGPLRCSGHHRLAGRLGLSDAVLRLCHRPQRLAHPLQP